MIALTRLNGTPFCLNAELIEQVESMPDTLITTTTGNNILVLEPLEDVIEKILEYRQQVASVRQEERRKLVAAKR